MKVICINDDFSTCPLQEVQNILRVGDDGCLPRKGEVYEVIGHAHWDEYRGKKNVDGYILLGLESTEAYGIHLAFGKDRFEIWDDTFVSNHVTEDGMLVRKMDMYLSFTMNFNDPQ